MGFRNNVAGDFGRRRCNNNVAGDTGRRCECVYECLFELLENAGENNNHCCHRNNSVSPDGGFDRRRRCDCECVFECLLELLEDALEEEDHCRCPR